MPRIRNIHDLTLFRPDKRYRYKNIDTLFSGSIDFKLIETHLRDMLRGTVSIKKGQVSASTILRRLGTYSRKNKLYFAFRELGKVVRTIFLLRYINEIELHQTIQSSTNKSEEFNCFAKRFPSHCHSQDRTGARYFEQDQRNRPSQPKKYQIPHLRHYRHRDLYIRICPRSHC